MRKTRTFIFVLLLLLTGCSKKESATQTEAVNQPISETEKHLPLNEERALKLIKVKDSVAPFFEAMGTPEEYDWLASFKESGQTFEEYITGNPTLPTAERQTIYIQPIGQFSPTELKLLASMISSAASRIRSLVVVLIERGLQ